MNKKRIGLITSALVAGGLVSTALGSWLPAVSARVTSSSNAQAVFDPCAATAKGKLRYSVGSSRHLVFAISSAYSSNQVVVTECEKKGTGWRRYGAVNGRAGTNGFAQPGAKREGDGKTPTGAFPLTGAFGMGQPGTALPYLKLRASGDCWGSTPGASYYNRYYTGTCRSTDENLSAEMARGPYRQAVIIGYNRPKVVSGHGSAIFFHVGGKTPTAGCVSIAESTLRKVMATLVKGDQMIMGPQSRLFLA